MKQTKYYISLGVVVIALFCLIFLGFNKDTMVYYVTIEELEAAPVYDKRIRVVGNVVDGSIQTNLNSLKMQFTIAQDDRRIPITYTGVVPDTFKEGAEVVAEGRYYTDRTFEAETVMAKCPSKYEGADYKDHEASTGSSSYKD